MKKKQSEEPIYVEVRLQRLTTTHAYGSISLNQQRLTYEVGLASKPKDNVFYGDKCVMVLARSEKELLTDAILDYMAHGPANMVGEMLKSGTFTEKGEMEIREFGRVTASKPTKTLSGLLRKLSAVITDIN